MKPSVIVWFEEHLFAIVRGVLARRGEAVAKRRKMIALFEIGPIAKHRFNITLLGVLIAVIIGLAIDQARAEPQTRFYDSQGRSIGTAAPYGNGSVRYYDAYGRSL